MDAVIRKSIITVLGLLLLSATAWAGQLNGPVIITSADMLGFFTGRVTADAPWNKADLLIENFTTRPLELSLPTGKIEFREISRMANNHLGRKMLIADVLVNGRQEGQVKMFGDLKLLGDTLLLTRKMGRHEIVMAGDVKLVRQDVSSLDSGRVVDMEQAIGKRLKTTLRAGSVLYGNYLDEPPLVKRGELVTILAKGGGLTISAKGEAKRSAARGEMVRVKNLMSRRLIYARVVDVGLVEVDF